jgi:Tol biopolymer transport system component
MLLALSSGTRTTPGRADGSSTYRIAMLGGVQPGGIFGRSNVFVMALDGSGLRQVTLGDFRKEQPDWSPDGSRIVHTSTGGEFGPANIFTVLADGTHRVRLTRGNGYDIHPDWSPDGSLIAFSSDQAGNPNYEIYVIHTDGSGISRLTHRSGADLEPAWSPDGRHIAFDRNLDQIWIMDADGSSPRMVTKCRPADCFEKDAPDWSPDGKSLVFLWGKDPHYELRTIAIDGTGERLLLDCQLPCLGVGDPQWSPDGRFIAFTYIDAAAKRHAYVMNADGTGVRPLPDIGMETCCVAWRPG